MRAILSVCLLRAYYDMVKNDEQFKQDPQSGDDGDGEGGEGGQGQGDPSDGQGQGNGFLSKTTTWTTMEAGAKLLKKPRLWPRSDLKML